MNEDMFPIEYKLLELKLIINRELYDNNIIDLDVFNSMENNILNKMNRIKNNLWT